MAIVYKIGFEADTSGVEAGLKSIASEIDKTMRRPGMFEGLGEELKEGVRQARILEQALSKATSASGISFTKLNTEIQKAGSSVKDMVTGLSNAGMTNSLNQMLEAFSRADRQLVTINKRVQELGRVMTQSFKFSMAQEALQSFRTGLSEVVNYVKELDSAMNSIQIVTGKTADQMTSVTQNAIESARQLRVSAKDYADASLIFYQQGLADDEVKRRSDTTIMAAKAAGESVSQMSQELTAVWNTYQMEGEQLERAASIGAKLGAETAVDFKYIAEAMGIAATSAAQLGTSYESLSSIIATVGSVTQQSASVVGTAYRTIFTRLSNLKLDGETEDGVKLGQITKQLAEVGVNALDANGELRKTDELIMELGTHWGEYSQAQQAAIAQVVGGTRQFGQFLALMQNFDTYLQNMQSAMSETGSETLVRQYETSLDTIDSKMTNAAEAWRRAFAQIFTADSLKGFYGVLEDVGNGVENLIDGFGGIQSVVVVIGKLLSKHVVSALFDASKALKTMWENRDAEHALGYMNKQIREMQDGIKKTAAERVNMLMSSNSPTRGMEADITTSRATYDMMRVEATQQATQANILLNEQIAKGNEETRIRAESLQIQVDAMRQQTIEAINTTQALEKQARMSRERVDKDGEARSRSLFATGGKPEEDTMVNADKAVGSLTKAYQNLFKVMNSGEEVSADLEKSITQDIKNINNAISQIGQNENDAGIKQLGAQLKQQLEEVQNQLKVGESIDFTSMNSSLASSTSLMRSFMQAVEQSDVSLTDLGDGSEVMRLLQILSQLSAESNELQVNMQTLNSLVKQTGQESTTANVSAQTLATGFVNLGGNIAMVIQGFTTLGQTMADDNATMMDYIGSLAMLAPSLITAGIETASLVKNLALKITATLGSAAADAVAAGATGGWAAMNVILSASFGPILIAVLAIVAAIAALVAIVWLVVKAFKAWQASTPEGKLKAAEQAANSFNSSLQDLKSTADDLTTSFDDYDTIVDKLKSCEVGTQEWRNQLLLLNNEINQILDKFPELAKYIQIDENGVRTFSQEGIEQYQNEILRRQEAAQIGSNMLDMNVNTAAGIVSKEDVIKTVDDSLSDLDSRQYKGLDDTFRTESEGLIINALEAKIDNLTGDWEQDKDIIIEGIKEQYNIEGAARLIKDNYSDKKESIDSTFTVQLGYIKDNYETISNYLAETGTIMTEELSTLQSQTRQVISSNQKVLDSENQEAVINAVVRNTGGLQKQLFQENLLDASATEEDIRNQLDTYKEQFLLDGKYGGIASDRSGVNLVTTDEKGNEETKVIKWAELAAAAAGDQFVEKVNEAANLLVDGADYYDKLINEAENKLNTGDVNPEETLALQQGAIALKDLLLNQNFDSTSLKTVKDLQNVDPATYIGRIVGDRDGTLTEEEAVAAGYQANAETGVSAAQAFINAFSEAVKGADWNNLGDQVKGLVNQGIDISTGSAKTYDSILKGEYANPDNLVGDDLTQAANALDSAIKGGLSEDIGKAKVEFEQLMALISQSPAGFQNLQDITQGILDAGSVEEYNHKLEDTIALWQDYSDLQYSAPQDGIISDEEAKDLDVNIESFEKYVDMLEDVEKENARLEDRIPKTRDEIAEQAEASLKTASAFEELKENWEAYEDNLNSKDLAKQGDAINKIGDAFEYALGFDLGDLDISNSFLTDPNNIQLVKDAINGVDGALENLRGKLFNEIIFEAIGEENVEAVTQDLIAKGLMLEGQTFEAAFTADPSGFINALIASENAANISADAVRAAVSSMGYEMTYDVEQSEVTDTAQTDGGFTWVPTYSGSIPYTYVVPGEGDDPPTTARLTIPMIGMKKVNLPSVPVSNTQVTGGSATSIKFNDGTSISNSPSMADISNVKITKKSTAPTSNSIRSASPTLGTGSGPAGSGGNKPKGGGGDSGPKFKPKEKRDPRDQREDLKREEDMEEFVERYENIDRALENNAAALEQAGDAGDRLFGKDRAQALMEQNKLLEEQNELLDWQIKDAEKYVQWDRDKLMTEFGIPKELLETNEDGSLKYREQIMQILEDRQEQQRQEYNDAMAQIHLSENQLVDQYNAAGDASEEADKAYEDASQELEYQKKALDDKWEGQQQNIQDTIDTLDEFEEAGARVFDGTQQKLENLREMWDNAFEARELLIEVQLEINERDIDFYEYIREGLGEDLENAALRTQYFKLEAGELASSWIEAEDSANNAMWDLMNADPAADNTKLWEAFDTAFDNIMDYGERFRDVREGYKEEYINALEDLRGRWDNLNGEVERQQDLISGMNDLLRETGLIYNDNEDSIKIMDNYVESMTTSLKLSSEEYQNALAREQELQEQLATWEKTGNKAMIDDIKEELAIAQEWRQEAQLGMIEAGAALASSVTEAMEHFRDVGGEAWMDQVSTMFNSFEDGAELLDQKLDLENYYMHENDKAFAIEEMIWQIEDAIDATSDPGQLDKYQELLDDLNAKKTDGKKVTEDEMAIYKAQLDLMLEQSRLEDARNAKNSMRLARDASGNWSYVYSQDTSETEDLERSIAEKQHNIDKMWRDYRQSRELEYYQILQDMYNFQQSKNDHLYATDENYRNWYDSRYNMYKEQLNNAAKEIDKALDHTGDNFKDTALGYVLDMDNMDETNKKYQGEIDKWEEACSDKYKDYSKTAEDAFESVGWDMEDLAGTMADESDKIIGEMTNVQDKVTDLKETSEAAFNSLISSQNAFRERWVDNMQQVCDSIDAYLERMQKFNQTMKGDKYNSSKDFTQETFDQIIADAPEDYRYDTNGTRPLDGRIAALLLQRQHKLDAMSEEERAKYATNEEVERILMQLSPSDLKWLSDLNKAAMQSESEMYQKYLVSEGGEGTYPTFDPYIDDFAAGMELLIERGLKGTFLYNQLRVGRQKKINVLALNNPDEYGAWYDWEDPNGFYNKYAKGGYTGNGSLSKGDHIPALLSSQEYVLNPEDTKNILHAVKVTRDIVQARVNGVLSNLAAQYLNITPQTGTQQSELKQKVKIEANFPNVQNRTEIEAAFDNLINKAAQYVLKDE